MNRAAVCFLVLAVPFDRSIKVSFNLEQNPKVRVLCVQRLIDFMVSDKYHLHIQRYWLRDESLSAGNSKPLSSLLNQDTSALQNSLQAIVGKLVFEQLNCAKNEVASISPVKRASLDESEICRESSKS